MKRVLSTLVAALCLAAIIGSFSSMVATSVYCGEEGTEIIPSSDSGGSLGDLVNTTTKTMEEGTETIVKFGRAGCILVMAISFIILMFSRDRQKTNLTISMIITAGLAFLGLIAVSNEWIVKFIESVGNRFLK